MNIEPHKHYTLLGSVGMVGATVIPEADGSSGLPSLTIPSPSPTTAPLSGDYEDFRPI